MAYLCRGRFAVLHIKCTARLGKSFHRNMCSTPMDLLILACSTLLQTVVSVSTCGRSSPIFDSYSVMHFTTSCSFPKLNLLDNPSNLCRPIVSAVGLFSVLVHWSNSFLLDVLPALSSAIPGCRFAQLPDTSIPPEFLGRGVILSFRHRHTYDCCLRKTDPVTLIS